DTERVLSKPQKVELFRKIFVFREMSVAPLTYLQSVQLLSEYLSGAKEPAESCPRLGRDLLSSIRTGPDLDGLRAGNVQEPTLLWNDISSDIRILPELIESGASSTAQAKELEQLA